MCPVPAAGPELRVILALTSGGFCADPKMCLAPPLAGRMLGVWGEWGWFYAMLRNAECDAGAARALCDQSPSAQPVAWAVRAPLCWQLCCPLHPAGRAGHGRPPPCLSLAPPDEAAGHCQGLSFETAQEASLSPHSQIELMSGALARCWLKVTPPATAPCQLAPAVPRDARGRAELAESRH